MNVTISEMRELSAEELSVISGGQNDDPVTHIGNRATQGAAIGGSIGGGVGAAIGGAIGAVVGAIEHLLE